MSVEFLVKLRDAALMIADAANEQLEKVNPNRTDQSYNPENIKWGSAEGEKGPYKRYPAAGEKIESTPDYKGLLAELKAHKGRLQRAGLFYWLFTDETTIGRKPAKKRT